ARVCSAVLLLRREFVRQFSVFDREFVCALFVFLRRRLVRCETLRLPTILRASIHRSRSNLDALYGTTRHLTSALRAPPLQSLEMRLGRRWSSRQTCSLGDDLRLPCSWTSDRCPVGIPEGDADKIAAILARNIRLSYAALAARTKPRFTECRARTQASNAADSE